MRPHLHTPMICSPPQLPLTATLRSDRLDQNLDAVVEPRLVYSCLRPAVRRHRSEWHRETLGRLEWKTKMAKSILGSLCERSRDLAELE